jgi:3-oxoadipate enol-lactonase
LIADALGLMDALTIEKAHFAGLSMGGVTALGFAEKHSDIAVAQKQGMEALVEPTVARWFPAGERGADGSRSGSLGAGEVT